MQIFVITTPSGNNRLMIDTEQPLDDRLAEFTAFLKHASIAERTETHAVLAVAGPSNSRHVAALTDYGLLSAEVCDPGIVAAAIGMIHAVELVDDAGAQSPHLHAMIGAGFVTSNDWAEPMASAERVTYSYLSSILDGFGGTIAEMPDEHRVPLIAIASGLAVAMTEAARTGGW